MGTCAESRKAQSWVVSPGVGRSHGCARLGAQGRPFVGREQSTGSAGGQHRRSLCSCYAPCCFLLKGPLPTAALLRPQEFPDPMLDPALRRLAARHFLPAAAMSPAPRVRPPSSAAPQRPPRSVLVQPIHGTNSDRWALRTARTARSHQTSYPHSNQCWQAVALNSGQRIGAYREFRPGVRPTDGAPGSGCALAHIHYVET